MKKLILAIGFLIVVFSLHAGDGDYAVSKISPALLKNADAVLRLEELSFEVISTRQAIEKNHFVITILNENGDKWSEFAEYYDKLREVSSVEGYLYDANGKQLKKMKYKDLEDISGVGESSLIEDNRIKRHNFYYRVYPYTIEYDIEIHYNHTMFFPGWIPQGDEKLSVELSRFTVICPSDYQFRYKAFNYNGEPHVTTEKNKKTTVWFAKDMLALIEEANQPDWHELTTTIITAPTSFQFGDYKGDMSSWQGLGKFQYTLNQGRDNLPESIKQDIHRLTDEIKDVRKKIQVLYEYMQKRTRYISIQLGIGGWQPFDAAYVSKKGYGDCKALSNYMYSILKEAGIRSNYTLIRAGRDEKYITDDFPSRQFNHAILSIPLDMDTMWLECTSQNLPAGYLSGFTADRYALAVAENGSKLVRTPKYGLNDNLEIRKVKAILNDDASLQVQVVTDYKGLQQDDVHDLINYLSKDKVKEYLQKQLDFPTYDLDKFDYKESKSIIPEVEEKLDLYVSNYATITGKRLFITPNVMTRSYTKLKTGEERKYDIVLHNEYKDIDSVEIEIPKGYEPEAFPQPVIIETKFGKYYSASKLVDNKILYYRTREQYSGVFSAKDYAALVNYYDAIYKADRNRIVLVKKENN
jgi:hypothetical protein